ncbi:MAG TPA: methyltransferase [Polyangiaceae bacterium]|nr:methyltransferase [Polyangiaceae bacterium]
MKAAASVAYALLAYALFLMTVLYAVGFVGNIAVPKSIDTGSAAPLGEALLVNTLLLGLFAVQHSVMARPAFKRWWTRFVPPQVERSTFVLFANLALLLLYWQWRPMPATIWNVTHSALAFVLDGLFWFGWTLVLISTFLINHFELFGLKQVFARVFGQPTEAPKFKSPGLYRIVRHPIYLGFLCAFWSTSHMTAGHLLFALATTGYILIGIQLEERDLIDVFGDRYRRYRERVRMLLPLPRRKAVKIDGDRETAPASGHTG